MVLYIDDFMIDGIGVVEVCDDMYRYVQGRGDMIFMGRIFIASGKISSLWLWRRNIYTNI